MQDLFQALVFQRRPGFQTANLGVGLGGQGEGSAAELPMFGCTKLVWIGQEVLV